MNKYLKLISLDTKYATRMNRLSNQIFQEVTKPTNSKSMKVVKLFSAKPLNQRPEIVDYYPRHSDIDALMSHLRLYGLYRNEHQDFNDEYDRARALRGKKKWVPPKFREQ